MADGYVQADPDGSGKKIDTAELTVNAQTVERQRVSIGDGTAAEQFLAVDSSGRAKVDGSSVTQPVSAASLPLPSGAAQDGTDGTGITSPTGGGGIRGWLSGIYKAVTGTLKVDGSAVTQPVSGMVDVGNLPVTQPVSGSLSVSNFPATQPVSGTVAVSAVAGTVAATQSGGWTVGVSSLPALPAGTNAIGTVGVTSLPALPTGSNVVGAVTQSGAWSVTVSGTVAVTQSGAWSVGRTWTLANTTDSVNVGNFPATQPVSGTVAVSAVSGTVAVTQSGSWTTARSWTLASGTDSVTSVPATVSAVTGASDTTIATGGTAVQLPNQAATQGVIVQGLTANVGTVRVGGSGVLSAGKGIQLQPGQSAVFPVSNANALYVNGPNVGDGVTVLAV